VCCVIVELLCLTVFELLRNQRDQEGMDVLWRCRGISRDEIDLQNMGIRVHAGECMCC
jgi:hypothetical protein